MRVGAGYARVSIIEAPSYRSGELTRGMLVVDRRGDEHNFQLGEDRSQVQAQNIAKEGLHLESKEGRHLSLEAEGVIVVTESPGPQKLLRLMFERIWGVEGLEL